MVGYVALVAAIFPSVEGSPELDELVESYPDVLKSLFGIAEGASIATGAGYLDVELFSFMLPLLVLVLAIGSGARTFAGEEDAGKLELLLSYPVRRRSAVLAKGAAVGIEIVLVSLAAGVGLLVLDPVFDLGLRVGNVAGALATLAALGLVFGWLALGLGAAVGHRALAIGMAAGSAAAAYLVNGLHELAGWLDPLRFLSPFWLVGSSPLQGDTDWAGVLVVAIVAGAFLVTGAILVERRDLQVP